MSSWDTHVHMTSLSRSHSSVRNTRECGTCTNLIKRIAVGALMTVEARDKCLEAAVCLLSDGSGLTYPPPEQSDHEVIIARIIHASVSGGATAVNVTSCAALLAFTEPAGYGGYYPLSAAITKSLLIIVDSLLSWVDVYRVAVKVMQGIDDMLPSYACCVHT